MIFGTQKPFSIGWSNYQPHLSPEHIPACTQRHPGPGMLVRQVKAHSPLRSRLWVESCRALSGQFQRSHPNWNLHSSIPLCAPAATLLEYVR